MKAYKPEGSVSILTSSSSGIESIYMRVYKNRRGMNDEEKLEKINISIIKQFLRKTKLNKINKNMREEKYKIQELFGDDLQYDIMKYSKYLNNYQQVLYQEQQSNDEKTLENMDIQVIEKFLRKKKLEKINQK